MLIPLESDNTPRSVLGGQLNKPPRKSPWRALTKGTFNQDGALRSFLLLFLNLVLFSHIFLGNQTEGIAKGGEIWMDKVVEAVEKAKKEWDEAYSGTQEHIKAIEEYGKSKEERNSLPRLNGLAQDGLALLSSLQFKLDLLAPQLPSDHEVQSATALLHSWKNQSQKYSFFSSLAM
jgi:hypothetical protein